MSHYYMQAVSLGTFISLVISLAANNSIVLPAGTSALENISVDITILGGTFLQRSVNIFGGIFVALSIILQYCMVGSAFSQHWIRQQQMVVFRLIVCSLTL